MPRPLKFAGLQGRTIRAYRLSVERFCAYLRQEGLSVHTNHRLDVALGSYLDVLYQEGDSLAHAGHLLSGIKRFCPELRLHLPTASQYFRNWQRIHRPERAVPISWDLLQAMAGLCLTLGYPRVALMLYIGFFCFLRTSEMLALQSHHLLLHPKRSQMTVIIPFAKTTHGNPQVLMFEDPFVCHLARLLLQELPPATLLWQGQGGSFRTFWHALLEALHFSPGDYSPYGIRRGGATWHFMETASMDATLQRGRWTSAKTAKLYLDEGTMAMANFFWSPAQSRAVRKWSLKGAQYHKRLRQKN